MEASLSGALWVLNDLLTVSVNSKGKYLLKPTMRSIIFECIWGQSSKDQSFSRASFWQSVPTLFTFSCMMMSLKELQIGCLFSHIRHLIIASIAESETKGLLTLIAPSRVLNHLGRDWQSFAGRWSCNLTMAIEQSLKDSQNSWILVKFLTTYPSLTKNISNLALIFTYLISSLISRSLSSSWYLILSGGRWQSPVSSQYFILMFSCSLLLIFLTLFRRSIRLQMSKTASLRQILQSFWFSFSDQILEEISERPVQMYYRIMVMYQSYSRLCSCFIRFMQQKSMYFTAQKAFSYLFSRMPQMKAYPKLQKMIVQQLGRFYRNLLPILRTSSQKSEAFIQPSDLLPKLKMYRRTYMAICLRVTSTRCGCSIQKFCRIFKGRVQLSSCVGMVCRICLKAWMRQGITNSFFSLMVQRFSSSSLPKIHRLTRFVMEISFFLQRRSSASTRTFLSSSVRSQDLMRRWVNMKSRTARLMDGWSSSRQEMSELTTRVLRLGKLFSTELVSIPSLIWQMPCEIIKGTVLSLMSLSSWRRRDLRKGAWLSNSLPIFLDWFSSIYCMGISSFLSGKFSILLFDSFTDSSYLYSRILSSDSPSIELLGTRSGTRSGSSNSRMTLLGMILSGVQSEAMGDQLDKSKGFSLCWFSRWAMIFSLDLRSGRGRLLGFKGFFSSSSSSCSSRQMSENPRESSNSSSPRMYSILSMTLDRNLMPPSLQSLYLRMSDHVTPMTYLLPTLASTLCRMNSMNWARCALMVAEQTEKRDLSSPPSMGMSSLPRSRQQLLIILRMKKRCSGLLVWTRCGRMLTLYTPRSSAKSLMQSLILPSTLPLMFLKSRWWMLSTVSCTFSGRMGFMHWFNRFERRILSAMQGEGKSVNSTSTFVSQL